LAGIGEVDEDVKKELIEKVEVVAETQEEVLEALMKELVVLMSEIQIL
jgi:hypothetical protein